MIHPEYPEKQVRIGQQMHPGTWEAVEQVLKENHDMFAWQPEDMVGIDPRIVMHKLNIQPDAKPVQQQRRRFGAQQDEIIRKEAEELLAIEHIREIQFPRWLVNVVLVPKRNGNWRMCVDFQQLNKSSYHCPN